MLLSVGNLRKVGIRLIQQTKRNKAIIKLIDKRTKEITRSRKTARDTLIAEGVYTKDGKLSPDYGGPKTPK